MLKDLFHKKKYATINMQQKKVDTKPLIDENLTKIVEEDNQFDEELWIKCKKCGEVLLKKDLKENLSTCTKCDYHFRLGVRDRLNTVVDEDSFVEFDKELKTANPLDFPGYMEKIDQAQKKTDQNEGVITGEGKINGISFVICVMDPNFMMGSMGSVVGEKISRAVEKAIEKRLPVVIFCASGGARMQEGLLSLMQMAKTSAAIGKLSDEGLLYISVLTDPTTGGVTASFAMLGDIILAERKALIGFAGPRVIEQTIRQKLPEGFQRAEFLKEKGFVDKIVHRKDLKETLYNILSIHTMGGEKNE